MSFGFNKKMRERGKEEVEREGEKKEGRKGRREGERERELNSKRWQTMSINPLLTH